MKILPPTLREKKRYIKFEVISEAKIKYSDLEAAVWNVMLDFHGELGFSQISLWLMKDLWDEKRNIGVVSCTHKSVSQVIACLGLIRRLGDVRVIIRPLKVSGTIKSLKL